MLKKREKRRNVVEKNQNKTTLAVIEPNEE